MAARSVHVILLNKLPLPNPGGLPEPLKEALVKVEDHLDHGIWTRQPADFIGDRGEWGSESSGILTGTQGWVVYKTGSLTLRLEWNNPYAGENSYQASVRPEGKLDGSGFSIGYFGGGGENAEVTFVLLPGICAVNPNTGEITSTTAWPQINWDHIGHANSVVAMAAIKGKLFAATSDNKLWWRDPVGQDVNWDHIGHANNVVAMAATNGRTFSKLFAATSDNKLWWRDPVGQDVNWDHIGHANDVVAMTETDTLSYGNKLFAATSDNKLWWRDPVGHDVDWNHIGHANNVVAMAEYSGRLFAATSDNKLWWREAVAQDVNWEHMGHANNVVAMAAINGKLFAATSDNKLWWRDPVGEVQFGR